MSAADWMTRNPDWTGTGGSSTNNPSTGSH
jgi:hypothetical protein